MTTNRVDFLYIFRAKERKSREREALLEIQSSNGTTHHHIQSVFVIVPRESTPQRRSIMPHFLGLRHSVLPSVSTIGSLGAFALPFECPPTSPSSSPSISLTSSLYRPIPRLCLVLSPGMSWGVQFRVVTQVGVRKDLIVAARPTLVWIAVIRLRAWGLIVCFSILQCALSVVSGQ